MLFAVLAKGIYRGQFAAPSSLFLDGRLGFVDGICGLCNGLGKLQPDGAINLDCCWHEISLPEGKMKDQRSFCEDKRRGRTRQAARHAASRLPPGPPLLSRRPYLDFDFPWT